MREYPDGMATERSKTPSKRPVIRRRGRPSGNSRPSTPTVSTDTKDTDSEQEGKDDDNDKEEDDDDDDDDKKDETTSSSGTYTRAPAKHHTQSYARTHRLTIAFCVIQRVTHGARLQ